MIFQASQLALPARLQVDVCVVGSGPGGSMVAAVCARAGLSVLVLEAGPFCAPAERTQREEEMLPRLLWDGGGRTTRDRAVRIHQGRGVGGSSLHNLCLCKRIPAEVLAGWRASRGLAHLPPERWDALYAEVEALLGVTPVVPAQASRPNHLLEAGCRALGWRGGWLRHNREGCVGSGFCELGCAYDAKNDALKRVMTHAVGAGADVLTHCQAVRIRHDDARALGVEARALDPLTQEPCGRVEVRAREICLAASATATPALLIRSGVPDPGGETGQTLRLHPAVVVAGDFEAPVNAWRGVPQGFECTEWLDFRERRIWIVPAFAHPVGFASMLPGAGMDHRALAERYPHLAVLTAMLHDETQGQVAPQGELGLAIDYWPGPRDLSQLAQGLAACAGLLFAAGAKRVLVPSDPVRTLDRPAEAAALRDWVFAPGELELTAVHPMGSVPMGDDPAVAALDSRGKHHHLEGLWVADGSLFPSSIGVPPQLSVYALGLHVGQAITHARGAA